MASKVRKAPPRRSVAAVAGKASSPREATPPSETIPEPRREAHAPREVELLATQRSAVGKLLGHIRHATNPDRAKEVALTHTEFPYLTAIHRPRNRTYLLQGPRGVGKSSVLLLAVDLLNRSWAGDPTPGWDDIPQSVLPLRPVSLEHLPTGRSLPLQVLQGFRRIVRELEKTESLSGSLSGDDPPYVSAWRRLAEAVALGRGEPMTGRRATLSVSQYVAEVDDVEARLGDTSELFSEFVGELANRLSEDGIHSDVQFLLSIDDADMCPERLTDVLDAIRTFRSPRLCVVMTGQLSLFESRVAAAYEGDSLHEARALAAAVLRKVIPPAQVIDLSLSRVERVDYALAGFANSDVDLRYRLLASLDAVPATMRELADIRQAVALAKRPENELGGMVTRLLLERHADERPSRQVIRLLDDGVSIKPGGAGLTRAVPVWKSEGGSEVRVLSRSFGPLAAGKFVAGKPEAAEPEMSDAASAAYLLALTRGRVSEWERARFVDCKPEDVLAGSMIRVSRGTLPEIEIPTPLLPLTLDLPVALAAWGRWWSVTLGERQLSSVPLSLRLLWTFASLGTATEDMPVTSDLPTIVGAGRAHPIEAIRDWFRSDVYLLCLPEWCVVESRANELWHALGSSQAPPNLDRRSRELFAAVASGPGRKPLSPERTAELAAAISSVRAACGGYEATKLISKALKS